MAKCVVCMRVHDQKWVRNGKAPDPTIYYWCTGGWLPSKKMALVFNSREEAESKLKYGVEFLTPSEVE